MTKPIKSGTGNTSLNAPRAWLQGVAKAANRLGKSQGTLFKEAVEGLIEQQDPQLARTLRAIRNASIAITLLASLAGQWIAHKSIDMARVKTAKVRAANVGKKHRDSDEGEWFLGWEVA